MNRIGEEDSMGGEEEEGIEGDGESGRYEEEEWTGEKDGTGQEAGLRK